MKRTVPIQTFNKGDKLELTGPSTFPFRLNVEVVNPTDDFDTDVKPIGFVGSGSTMIIKQWLDSDEFNLIILSCGDYNGIDITVQLFKQD